MQQQAPQPPPSSAELLQRQSSMANGAAAASAWDTAAALHLLKAIMTAFTLRRRKEMKFVDLRLPKLDEYVHRIEFTKKERERYDALTAEAQGLLKNYEKKAGKQGQGAGQAFQHLLEILLRMRPML